MYSTACIPVDLLLWITSEQEQLERERGETTTEKTVGQQWGGEPDPLATGPVGQPSWQTPWCPPADRERLPAGRPSGLEESRQAELPPAGTQRPPRLPAAHSRSRQRDRKGRYQ